MIIAVNTRLLLKDRLEGIGWFMYENLRRITVNHPEHTFLFLFDRAYDPDFIFSKNVLPLVVPPPTRHPVLWYLWFEYSLPGILKKHKADLYLGPDGYMPLNLKIPSLVTIHDINFQHRPMDLPRASRIYYRKYFPRFARKSERITTVSEFSKTDIVKSYGIDPGKIDVIYNGVNEIFSPLNPDEAKSQRNKLTEGMPYFVFVGSMHPRKNLTNLMLGFDKFKSSSGNYKLVIVGEKMFMTGDIEKTYSGLKHAEDIVFTGRLSPPELREVLGASSGLTFVPLFEGFGIPLLEAMKCEVPILASNVTSLPEVAADTAIYVDPLNIKEIEDGMTQLASNADLRSRLINAGKKRGMNFSWDKTSKLYWKSICKVIDTC